ncbi:MAG: Crp/Fnr family transcriptional regulator [Oscillospiraceae bacterium]|nr:Crp/Fnr family transcriptional regulator [Oscillospiraceae bacterium]
MIPEILDSCILFHGIDPRDRTAMLGCLGAKELFVPRNHPVFSEGEPANYIGIVLSGQVQLVREDYYGNRSIISVAAPGQLFGESFACADVEVYPISAVAVEDSRVLLFPSSRITATCCNACSFHQKMIYNMLRAMATSNLALNEKIEITSKRTTREKLMAYLLSQAKHHGSNRFTIPYDRQELADYLEVERSAMSAEISKLKKDGLIDCKKSEFEIFKNFSN